MHVIRRIEVAKHAFLYCSGDCTFLKSYLQSCDMELLEPDFNQERPTFAQAQVMCQELSLESRPLFDCRYDAVLNRLRETHANGGALFASFNVGFSEVFDWFASRNRLSEFGILRQLLDRPEIGSTLPELQIEPLRSDDPALVVHKLGACESVDMDLAAYGIGVDFEIANTGYDSEFRIANAFLFEGELAAKLYHGGAYTKSNGDGRSEKKDSLAFCEALFESRVSEIQLNSTYSAWTPWFAGIAWDWTSILFDRRARTLSILVTTDTD